MNIKDRFVIHQGEPCFDTKDGKFPLMVLDITRFNSWHSQSNSLDLYTPTVLEVIHTIVVLSDQVYEEQLITELEEYLYGINQGSP